MTPIIFSLLLPAVVFGGMIIDIDVKTPQPKVEVHGKIEHVVSGQERETFGITDEQLKKAIAIYINDTEPSFVSVNKIGRTHGLYGKFNEWVGVKTTVTSRLINITKNCYHSGAPESIKNDIVIKTNWKISGKVSTSENSYNIYAKENITFKSAWEENISIYDVIGTILPSNEEQRRGDIPFVEAIKCDIVIRLEYEATSSGDVVAYFTSKKKNKYHVQAYDVVNLLDATGLPRSVINTEIISISYYYKHKEQDGVDDYEYGEYNDYDGNGEVVIL